MEQEKKSNQINFFGIDPRRIIGRILKYWYILFLCLLLGLGIAFLVNRYSDKFYLIEGSILIKETEEVTGGEILYNNPLVKFYRNYLNELYLLKSIPLAEQTVNDLGLNKIFYGIGDIRTSELYKRAPISIQIVKENNLKSIEFFIKILDGKNVELKFKDYEKPITVVLDDTIEIEDIKFILTPEYNYNSFLIEEQKTFKFVYKGNDDLAISYSNRLKAEWAEEGAGVVNLSITGTQSQKELDYLNKLIENYQTYDLDKKNKAASNALNFIDEQINGIRDTLHLVENQLASFKNETVVTDLNAEAIRLYQKLEGFEIQKAELYIRSNYYDYLNNYLAKSEEFDQIILPTSVGIQDVILSNLMENLLNIQTELKLSVKIEQSDNPIVNGKRRRIQNLKQDIIESIQNQKNIDQIKIDFLNKNIKSLEIDLRRIPLAEQQLINIKRKYALLENLYTFLLQKRTETGISKATNVSDVIVVNPPRIVTQVSPVANRNLLLGVLLGISLPIFLFIFIEIFNAKVQSREDIENHTSIPFIGGAGHSKLRQNLEILSRPKSAISESFRVLRSNLFYFLEGKQKGVILITSSIGGEGKTFTTINLSSVLAMSGKKTLIVGADMRKPKIFNDFKLDNKIGLSNYLAGMAEFDEVVRKTEFDDIYLVSGGPVPPNPSELIMSGKMQEFVNQAKENFDFVIIDSPPLALVTDAFILSELTDHTLFIVRQDYTPQILIKTINDYYSTGKIEKLSIFLNDIHITGLGYSYGYGYGYGYGGNKGNGYYE